jgi:hypothetical protein
MIKVRRRNWTSRGREYSRADAIVVSFPKSGRTWLRVFLYAYFCRSVGREFTVSNRKLAGTGVPKLMFTHDLWGHVSARRVKDRWLGKNLIPPGPSRTKSIILIARDPRDVVVSFFFQITKRANHPYHGDLATMIRDPRLGIGSIIGVMNAWMEEWGERENFKIVRYEDCKTNTEAAFRDVLAFLKVVPIDESVLQHSLQFSSFENMKKMESAAQFKNKILSARNVDDPDSYKTRRGIVGGFTDYLGPADIQYMNEVLTHLDPRFGYRPGAAARVAIQNG